MLKKKICLLGSYGVGKTSLVGRFVHSMFADKYHTTVGVKIDKKVLTVGGEEVTLMLWDMAGEEDGAPVKLNQVKDASGYLLVADGTRGKTLDVAGRRPKYSGARTKRDRHPPVPAAGQQSRPARDLGDSRIGLDRSRRFRLDRDGDQREIR